MGDRPRITPTEDGPYLIEGASEITRMRDGEAVPDATVAPLSLRGIPEQAVLRRHPCSHRLQRRQGSRSGRQSSRLVHQRRRSHRDPGRSRSLRARGTLHRQPGERLPPRHRAMDRPRRRDGRRDRLGRREVPLGGASPHPRRHGAPRPWRIALRSDTRREARTSSPAGSSSSASTCPRDRPRITTRCVAVGRARTSRFAVGSTGTVDFDQDAGG